MKQTFKKLKGFTLIELLIVIVILGLLASLVAPTMFSKVSSSQRSTAAAQMQMLQTSLDTYRLDMGDYPDTLEELRRSEKPGWDGPYLPKAVPLDPWGNPYVYKNEATESMPFYLASMGKDGQPGGNDDNADIVHK
ncbi:type II secretion system protein GspG [Vibrio rotiferianus]|uniref:Type II secretion system core protein G n=1 Tax=Vibrio rotiferianus TaxID=190895 RepID=A0A510I580_9VIBR|nr:MULTISPECIES: type II secretion system major pseudopilin GspG [Vibrio harveyi group]NOH65199.1 type II secretion system protein GspG [Vibrio rotiferianus]TMX44360.1 type II secretion system protein GspG [Vibrio rotiferianus]TMX48755.1 type II secretion system protein GspG [Vibrio rotiferianus]TMX58637.1 type II secretion system protein GspG [Vibrio rotiferianus]TMX61981.1 type II secretion system protein GspG [Vibrio rotiferianus]